MPGHAGLLGKRGIPGKQVGHLLAKYTLLLHSCKLLPVCFILFNRGGNALVSKIVHLFFFPH